MSTGVNIHIKKPFCVSQKKRIDWCGLRDMGQCGLSFLAPDVGASPLCYYTLLYYQDLTYLGMIDSVDTFMSLSVCLSFWLSE